MNSTEELSRLENQLSQEFAQIKAKNLQLDLTRGKPNTEQLCLSDELDGILRGSYKTPSGVDLRNYGGLDGIKEAKELFSQLLQIKPEETLIGGNSSLTLMYLCVAHAMYFGFKGPESAWRHEKTIRFLCPVPGYDRHFTICEQLGIELIPVAMTEAGPDMDQVEQLVRADQTIKGIWCVPRFSNPTGTVYSDATVERIAKLGQIAGPHFIVMWDNAYAVHTLEDDAQELAPIMEFCRQSRTEDNVLQFSSTSKITFAGAGVAFMGASSANLTSLLHSMSAMSIGPDKINQMRHVTFLKDLPTIKAHMAKHAALIKPRFDIVFRHLREGFGNTDLGRWTEPKGGYFVSFDTRPGLARKVVAMAAEAGVKLTPAGATHPYGKDPLDCTIRLAPTVPSLAELDTAMQVFVLCVKLASVRQALSIREQI